MKPDTPLKKPSLYLRDSQTIRYSIFHWNFLFLLLEPHPRQGGRVILKINPLLKTFTAAYLGQFKSESVKCCSFTFFTVLP